MILYNPFSPSVPTIRNMGRAGLRLWAEARLRYFQPATESLNQEPAILRRQTLERGF
jgi:hypothetical protein